MNPVGTVLLLVPLLASCGGRGEVRILDYTATAPTALQVYVDACNADAALEDVTETATEVRVLVLADGPGPWGGSDCADGVQVQLLAPLGTREVVDASSGRVVTTEGGTGPRPSTTS